MRRRRKPEQALEARLQLVGTIARADDDRDRGFDGGLRRLGPSRRGEEQVGHLAAPEEISAPARDHAP